MKKIVIVFFMVFGTVFLGLFSGCGVYDKINLEKLSQEMATLKTSTFDLSKIQEAIETDSSEFGELENMDLDFIPSEYFQKDMGYLFRQEKSEINSVSMTSYIIVKPAEDKKDLLEEQIGFYYTKLLEEYSQKEDAKDEVKEHLQNIMKKEYNGYLIYILSNDNESVWRKIEANAHSILFENTKEAELEEFGILEKDVDEFKAVTSNQDTSASFYIIIRAKNGKADNVRKSMNQYMKELDKKWSFYLPREYELVKNYMNTEVGSYLIYVVSKDNQLVLNTIKDAIVKKD